MEYCHHNLVVALDYFDILEKNKRRLHCAIGPSFAYFQPCRKLLLCGLYWSVL